MKRLAAAVLALAAVMPVMSGPALAAPHLSIRCPQEVQAQPRVTRYHHDDQDRGAWVLTGQRAELHYTAIETMGGQQVLVCKYRMFGQSYWVHRAIPADYPNCVPSTEGFACYPRR